MRETLIISFLTVSGLTAACGGAANQTATNQTAAPQNANAASQRNADADSLVVSSHATPKAANPGAAGGGGMSAPQSSSSQNQGEGSMAKRVDVTELTGKVEKAEKEYKQKPADAAAKDELAKAYFARAFVLTDAAQYRAALGDFRKGLKLKPDDADAKKMHDEILSIFKSLNREPPKEGEEPPPLPLQKS